MAPAPSLLERRSDRARRFGPSRRRARPRAIAFALGVAFVPGVAFAARPGTRPHVVIRLEHPSCSVAAGWGSDTYP